MTRPYRKILQDCRLSGDDKNEKQTKVCDDSIVLDEFHGECVYIDDSMVGLVRKLNDIDDTLTVSSCSGVFSEHYDVNTLEVLLPYSELLNSIGLTVENINMPVLGVRPVYHEETEQGYRVSEEFYQMMDDIGRFTYDVGNKRLFSWEVSVCRTTVSEDRNELVYTFRPTSSTFAQSLKLAESYEEMDDNIRGSISNLEDFLLERLG